MIPIALSPCPNDTFLFHAWIHGLVPSPLKPRPHFADIQELNLLACARKFPLIKVSFNCFKQLHDDYLLLPVGAALGHGCGPKIISLKPLSINDLENSRIAIPGEHTTAHLLLNCLMPRPKEKVFCLYHEIGDLLKRGVVDCGLIIHETRFTFAKEGFAQVCDLGEIWEERFSLPLPLGGLAARRDLDCLQELTETLQGSLSYAWNNPSASRDFVLEHSQEKDPAIVQSHIDLYVNQESYALSERGKKSIETLLEKSGLCRRMGENEASSLFYIP